MTLGNSYEFYRLKSSYYRENEDNGEIERAKKEELIMASCYTDAESTAFKLMELRERNKFDNYNYEISKAKIEEFVFNSSVQVDQTLVQGLIEYYFEEDPESGVGLYAIKVEFQNEDLDGKVKKTQKTIYTPAQSPYDALSQVEMYFRLQGETRTYVIRGSKFDKADSIFVTPAAHQINARDFDNMQR